MTHLLRHNWAVSVTIFCTRQSLGKKPIRDSFTTTSRFSHPPHYTEASHQKLCSSRTLITSYSTENTQKHIYMKSTIWSPQMGYRGLHFQFAGYFVSLNTAAVTGTLSHGKPVLPGICGVHFYPTFQFTLSDRIDVPTSSLCAVSRIVS